MFERSGFYIINYFGGGDSFGVTIEYFLEQTPLGNAGALFKMGDKLEEYFLLLNTGSIFDINFNRFVNYHITKGALVTLFTHPNPHSHKGMKETQDILLEN